MKRVATPSNIGRQWPSELTTYRDPMTGATVRQLTRYLGHSSHFYFTYPCWYDTGRKIIIASDRENRTNLFGVDWVSGDITQLTDFNPAQGSINVFSVSKNPAREEAYFFQGKALMALDLFDLDVSADGPGALHPGAEARAQEEVAVQACRMNILLPQHPLAEERAEVPGPVLWNFDCSTETARVALGSSRVVSELEFLVCGNIVHRAESDGAREFLRLVSRQ